MNVCDLVTGAKRLQKATKLLKERWVETRGYWNDQTAQEFEDQYLQPLGERAIKGHRPVEAMERLLFFVKKFPNNPQMLLEIKG